MLDKCESKQIQIIVDLKKKNIPIPVHLSCKKLDIWAFLEAGARKSSDSVVAHLTKSGRKKKDRKLVAGTFGTVYRVSLLGGEQVAVKEVSIDADLPGLCAEVEVSKKLRHKNLIRAHFFFLKEISCKKTKFPIMERCNLRETWEPHLFSSPNLPHLLQGCKGSRPPAHPQHSAPGSQARKRPAVGAGGDQTVGLWSQRQFFRRGHRTSGDPRHTALHLAGNLLGAFPRFRR